jgi:hypothetical protein
MKGHVTAFDEITPDDIADSARYCEGFFGDIEAADHFPRHLLERFRPDDLAACTFVIEDVFDQTPGPGAGNPLERAAS